MHRVIRAVLATVLLLTAMTALMLGSRGIAAKAAQNYNTRSEAPVFAAKQFTVASRPNIAGIRVSLVGSTATALPAYCEDVIWTDLTNVTATGSTIQKTGGRSGAWDAGAASTKAILAGDGWVQASVDVLNTRKLFGLSNGDSNAGASDVDFAAFLSGSTLKIYENGISMGSFGTLNLGDVVKVSVEGGIVKYYRNERVVYTSMASPHYPLLVDASIYTGGSLIRDASLCGANLGPSGLWGATATATATATAATTATDTSTSTRTPASVFTITSTPTWTLTATVTGTATATATQVPPSSTPTLTRTATPSSTATQTSTATATASMTATMTSTPTPTIPATGQPIYWGAYMSGSDYGYDNAPWDPRTISTFEAHSGKQASIIHWGQAWQDGSGAMQPFEASLYDSVRQHGSIPMINWNPWQSCCGVNQPNWSLSMILNGSYDAYIRQWATAARTWGHPFFLRMMDEMNGTWYPWSESVNSNRPGQFVQAWRHIHDIFTEVGTTNVAWVWCPNTEYQGSLPLEGLYPGDGYVDWVAIDGYNWGTNPAKPDVWRSFAQVFGPTYDHLVQIAPGKPIMIAELSSTEFGGSKADWITDGLTTQIPVNFPRIKAVVWFNWNTDGMDWTIETSSVAQAAFASGIASPYYAANNFASLSTLP